MNKFLLIICKLFLLLILNLLITGTAFSQVFVSNAVEGSILLGPDNVNHQKEATTNYYFSLIEGFKIQLNIAEIALQNKIHLLEEKKRLNKKNQKLLETYKFEVTKIASEKELLKKLIGDWMARIKSNKALVALSLLNDEVCYEVKTNKGTFLNDQLELYQDDTKDVKYEAFIPVSSYSQSTAVTGQWVKKKKSPNCISRNPDDCYVACYEKVSVTTTSYDLEDMMGNVTKMNVEPLAMTCNDKDQMCFLLNKNKDDNELHLSLKLKETGEDLEILSCQKIDCTPNKNLSVD